MTAGRRTRVRRERGSPSGEADPGKYPNLSCFALDDTSPRPPRRVSARGPGLRIPSVLSPEQPPTPRDISFAKVNNGDTNLDGVFGYLLASNNISSSSTSRPARSFLRARPPSTFRPTASETRTSIPTATDLRAVTTAPGRNLTAAMWRCPFASLATSARARESRISPPTSEQNWRAPAGFLDTWVRFPDRR